MKPKSAVVRKKKTFVSIKSDLALGSLYTQDVEERQPGLQTLKKCTDNHHGRFLNNRNRFASDNNVRHSEENFLQLQCTVFIVSTRPWLNNKWFVQLMPEWLARQPPFHFVSLLCTYARAHTHLQLRIPFHTTQYSSFVARSGYEHLFISLNIHCEFRFLIIQTFYLKSHPFLDIPTLRSPCGL